MRRRRLLGARLVVAACAAAALTLSLASPAGAFLPLAPTPFQSVSCSSASACTAVGPGLAERWDGLVWSVQPLADPQADLQGVSCPSASACIAVGRSFIGSSIGAQRWDGISWTALSLPRPADLTAVSCPSVDDCMAVGPDVAERWDGTSWSELALASTPPGSPSSQLTGVSCTAPDACTAVGSIGFTALIERWDGSSWTMQTTPTSGLPAAATSALASVSCTSATACTAVGFEDADEAIDLGCELPTPRCLPLPTDPFGVDAPVTLAESWNGHVWLVQPGATGTAGALLGVSCASASACTAVGELNPNTGPVVTPLVYRSTDDVWSPDAAQSPKSSDVSGFDSTSCVSATACQAVGGYRRNSGGEFTLAEGWNGKHWAIEPTS